jgi:hypothetical protein
MTANVKIPVASADQVTAVPLSAVFTERNPETGQMERYVYVVQDDRLERRNVTVGVSDYFYAEIQDGLKPGESVSLELPKDELEKKALQIAVLKPSGDRSTNAAKLASVPGVSATNSATLGTTGTSSEIAPKAVPTSAPTAVRAAGKS